MATHAGARTAADARTSTVRGAAVARRLVWVTTLLLCAATATAQNAIELENQLPGTTTWRLSGRIADDTNGQIQGFASDTSVDAGSSIDLYVTVSPAAGDFGYAIDVYRMGWYGGDRGRLMASFAGLVGVTQPPCTTVTASPPAGSVSGLGCTSWTSGFTLNVPASWTTGLYLAKLTNADGYQSYVPFAVRDDDRESADFFYQQAVLTYHAYNNYPNGSPSFYGGGPDSPHWDNTVSLDRPYGANLFPHNNHGDSGSGGDGSGGFFVFDFPMIGWLEREGYDVLYGTNVDLHRDPSGLRRVGAILSVGHDEYWTAAMGDHALAARDAGTNLAFFSGNSVFGTVELTPSAVGAHRVLRGLTRPAVGNVGGGDPDVARRQELIGLGYTTCCGRAPSIHYNPPWVVADAGHWIFEGTGFMAGDAVEGFNGPESDELADDYPVPGGTSFAIVASSPYGDGAGGDPRVVISPYGGPAVGHSAVFKAGTGGWVVNGAAMDWPWSAEIPYSTTLAFDPASAGGDPADQSWEPTRTGTASSTLVSGPGPDALRIDGVGGGLFWTRAPIPAQTQGATRGWRLTAEVRVESGGQNLLAYSGGGRRVTELRLSRDVSGDLVGDFSPAGVSATLATAAAADAYHVHVLEYDPATDRVAYRLDGGVVPGVPDLDPANASATTPLLRFGNASTATDGVFWIRSIALEILQPLVPDPRMEIVNRNVLDRLRSLPPNYEAAVGDGTPVDQGWSDGTTLAGSSSVVLDGGEPGLHVDGVGGGALYGFVPGAELAQRLAPNGWVLEADLRVESGEWLTVFHGDGAHRFLPRWAIDGGGDLVVTLEGLALPPIRLASGPDATAYHRHRILFDPATQQALYGFDDRWVALWSGSAGPLTGVFFGQGSSLIDGTGYIRSVGIAPNHAPIPVPEADPGPLGTIALAIAYLSMACNSGRRGVSSSRRSGTTASTATPTSCRSRTPRTSSARRR